MNSQYIAHLFFSLKTVVKQERIMFMDTSDVNALRQVADYLENEYGEDVRVITVNLSHENDIKVL